MDLSPKISHAARTVSLKRYLLFGVVVALALSFVVSSPVQKRPMQRCNVQNDSGRTREANKRSHVFHRPSYSDMTAMSKCGIEKKKTKKTSTMTLASVTGHLDCEQCLFCSKIVDTKAYVSTILEQKRAGLLADYGKPQICTAHAQTKSKRKTKH